MFVQSNAQGWTEFDLKVNKSKSQSGHIRFTLAQRFHDYVIPPSHSLQITYFSKNALLGTSIHSSLAKPVIGNEGVCMTQVSLVEELKKYEQSLLILKMPLYFLSKKKDCIYLHG